MKTKLNKIMTEHKYYDFHSTNTSLHLLTHIQNKWKTILPTQIPLTIL